MRVWTIPNVITMGRIVLIAAFGLLLVNHYDALAITVLALAGVSDFLDGYLARRWNQQTELGKILDPAADRLLTVVVVLGLAVRDIIPWWLVAVLLARDVVVGIALLIGRRRGREAPQVTFTGKLATAVLYVTLPLAYLAFERWSLIYHGAIVASAVGAVIYWISGIGYVRQAAGSEKAGAGDPASAELD